LTFVKNPRNLPNKFKIRLFAFFAATILIFSGKLIAQTGGTPFPKFGFQTGVNISNMNFNVSQSLPSVKTEQSWKAGFTIGVQLRVPLTTKLILQPEYTFNKRNGSDKSLAIEYSMNYFSLPVLLIYQISSRIGLLAGPQFEILLDAKASENNTNTNITHNMEERGIGLVGGLEFAVFKTLFLSARYHQGLNHVGLRQGTVEKEYKYQSFTLTAGIRF
jgi:hypothetical protein